MVRNFLLKLMSFMILSSAAFSADLSCQALLTTNTDASSLFFFSRKIKTVNTHVGAFSGHQHFWDTLQVGKVKGLNLSDYRVSLKLNLSGVETRVEGILKVSESINRDTSYPDGHFFSVETFEGERVSFKLDQLIEGQALSPQGYYARRYFLGARKLTFDPVELEYGGANNWDNVHYLGVSGTKLNGYRVAFFDQENRLIEGVLNVYRDETLQIYIYQIYSFAGDLLKDHMQGLDMQSIRILPPLD